MNEKAKCNFITPEELGSELSGMFLVDVRTAPEFRDIHIPGSVNMPLDQLPKMINDIRDRGKNKRLALICKTGTRSKTANQILQTSGLDNCSILDGGINSSQELIPPSKIEQTSGLDNCSILDGGINSWEEANMPVKRGQKSITIERQVRIAAGGLVLVGTLISVFINPLFLVIPGFVGVGLIFAGITDTCGMAIALSKMPWNRR